MRKSLTIHVLDTDTRRRASVARVILSAGYHAEVYDDLNELLNRMPAKGMVFVMGIEGVAISAVQRGLGELGVWLPIVALSRPTEAYRVVDAIKAGAIDCAWWPLEADEIRNIVDRVTAFALELGENRRKAAEAKARIGKLTAREAEVLDYLSKGGTSKDIADELNISHRTVEIHRYHIMKKLGARYLADAVRLVIEASWPGGVEA